MKTAREQVVKLQGMVDSFPSRLDAAKKKAEHDYMTGAECQTAFAQIYMDGFREAKSLVARAHPQLDLAEIEPEVEDDAISQAASKRGGQDQEGAERDDAQS